MLRVRFILVLALIMLIPGPVLAESQPGTLHLGVFPRRNPHTTEIMFSPLARYLGAHLQRPVVLETTPDFASFWDAVSRQRFDLVHYNQYHYIRSHRDYGYRVILQNEEYGHQQIAPAIVVRADSGIHSLSELKGKKIVFGGGRKAMIAYIGATYLLRQAGLNDGDYFEQYALTPLKAAIAAHYRQAAAAGAGNYILRLPGVRKQVGEDSLRYLAIGQPHAHLPWAVSPSLPAPLANKIQSLLSGLTRTTEGRAILKQAGLTGLNPAADEDYDPYRRITQAVLDESY
jgi:phosphonate transport system substrate-binding protein